MNKKCFVKEASVLLVLALMLSSVGAMAANTQSQTSSTSVKAVATIEDLPDLTIEFKITKSSDEYYYYDQWIHNNGTGAVPAGQHIVVKIFSNPVISYEYDGPLNPGEVMYNQGTLPKTVVSSGVLLAVVVDPPYEGHPNGDILESDETNNVCTCLIPHAKSSSLSPLFSSLNSQTQSSSSQQITMGTQQSTLQINQLLQLPTSR